MRENVCCETVLPTLVFRYVSHDCLLDTAPIKVRKGDSMKKAAEWADTIDLGYIEVQSWRMEVRADITRVIDAYARQQVAAALERIKPYLNHAENCAHWTLATEEFCTCGFAAIRA